MRRQGRRRKAEGGVFSQRVHCAHISFRLPPSTFRLPSSGVTLVELLITITIITILSATFLGVSNLAMESAREARTKTTIGKIHSLLMEKWAEYATRRVDIDRSSIPVQVPSLQSNGRYMADLRMLATRELMQLEMPDRWSDIIGDVVGATPLTRQNLPRILASAPGIRSTYLRRYLDVINIKDPAIEEERQAILANQGAECLYLIVMLTTGDGEARSLFSEQDFGDTDGDGALEILDGWGRPIRFIRWPAGFAFSGQSSLLSTDASIDHDPFDLFRRDQLQPTGPSYPPLINTASYPAKVQPHMLAMRSRHGLTEPIFAFRLVPLVYSAGADGDPDLATTGDALIYDPYLDYTQSNPETDTVTPSLGGLSVSDDDGDNWLDNIHNHLQDNR